MNYLKHFMLLFTIIFSFGCKEQIEDATPSKLKIGETKVVKQNKGKSSVLDENKVQSVHPSCLAAYGYNSNRYCNISTDKGCDEAKQVLECYFAMCSRYPAANNSPLACSPPSNCNNQQANISESFTYYIDRDDDVDLTIIVSEIENRRIQIASLYPNVCIIRVVINNFSCERPYGTTSVTFEVNYCS